MFLHLYNTFIPLNPAKYTRHSVSKMIQDAMNKKFDKVFIKEFYQSNWANIKKISFRAFSELK